MTPRLPCGAHQCSQLHDRLIERPCSLAPLGNDELRGLPDPALGCTRSSPGVKGPSQDSGDVGIHSRRGALVGKAGDSPRGIPAHSGEPPKRRQLTGDNPPVLHNHLLRQAVQVGSAAIIAQSLPAFPNHCGGGGGQRVDVGIGVEKAMIVLLDPCHLSLLKHELRNENAIRIASAAPWEISAVTPKPSEQRPAERRRVCRSIRRSHAG
jgi:hypothetical protein